MYSVKKAFFPVRASYRFQRGVACDEKGLGEEEREELKPQQTAHQTATRAQRASPGRLCTERSDDDVGQENNDTDR